jgi:hypothetical protein
VRIGEAANDGVIDPMNNTGSYAGTASVPQAAAGTVITGSGGKGGSVAVGAGGSASRTTTGTTTGKGGTNSVLGGTSASLGGQGGNTAAKGGAGGTGAGGKGGSSAGGTTASGGKGGAGGTTTPSTLDKFSFFVTSFKALQTLSKNDKGFGGDLRFGETGNGSGLRGADKICSTIAETSMTGAGSKVWRAFLSASNYNQDGKAGQVNAIDRIGPGPWYDRLGRTFAVAKADLLYDRPSTADAAIKNDFPNEDGIPNQQPDLNLDPVDNHDMLTGTNVQGQLYGATATCNDWTTSDGSYAGNPRVGHSWPRSGGGMGAGPGGGGDSMNNWMSALDEAGCAAGYNMPLPGSQADRAPDPNDNYVGSGGGYGGFYCFALSP